MKKTVLPYALAALMSASTALAQDPQQPPAPTNWAAPAPVGLNVVVKKPEPEANQVEGPTRAAAEALKKTAPAPAPTAGGGK